MIFQLAIFDFDGTLADSFPWLLSILESVGQAFHIQPPPAHEIDALRQFDSKTLIKMYGIPFWKLPIIARHVNRRMGKEISNIPLFEGVDRLFASLAQQGTQIAMVSSNSTANIRRVLGKQNCDLVQYWECGVSLFGKAGRLENVLRRSGVPPEKAICIGDEIRDLEAARKVGISFGAVSWGYAHVDALITRGADEVFASVDEMIRALTLDTPAL